MARQLWLVAILLAGCDGAHAGDQPAIAAEPRPDARADGLLAVANTSSETQLAAPFPDGAGLSARERAPILAFRRGRDGQPGTADDRSFSTLPELCSVLRDDALFRLVLWSEKLGALHDWAVWLPADVCSQHQERGPPPRHARMTTMQ